MNLERYKRQTIFPGLGTDGQQALSDATVVIVGCGATGTALANLLARMGVGRLRIIDRDFIELNNLQRQTLFDQADIDANLPKAEAAARKLRAVNRDIEIEAVVADVNAGNVLSLIQDATLVMDGTDNFSTRYLLNDACLETAIPWVYTGVIASYGMTATFIPDGAAEKLPGQRERHRLPALSAGRHARARQHAHLRHGRRHRPGRGADHGCFRGRGHEAAGRPRRSQPRADPHGCLDPRV